MSDNHTKSLADLLAFNQHFADTATLAERVIFTKLFPFSEELRRSHGIIGYYLPITFAERMGEQALRATATNIGKHLRSDIYYHLDLKKGGLYMGQIFDLQYVAALNAVVNVGFVPYVKRQPDRGAFSGFGAVQAITHGNHGQVQGSPAGNHGSLQGYPVVQTAMQGYAGSLPFLTTGQAPGNANSIPLSGAASPNTNGEKSVKKGSKSRRARLQEDHIPKPRNSWIIFRQDNHNSAMASHPNVSNSRISVVISEMWRDASPEVKAKYKQLADEEKAAHRAKYPLYKLTPRKSSEIKKRKHIAKQDVHDALHATISEMEVPVFDGDIVVPEMSNNGTDFTVSQDSSVDMSDEQIVKVIYGDIFGSDMLDNHFYFEASQDDYYDEDLEMVGDEAFGKSFDSQEQ